jgi:hypothetical protein
VDDLTEERIVEIGRGNSRSEISLWKCLWNCRETGYGINESITGLIISNSTPKHKRFYKGKAVPLQARSGPEGSRKLRFPDFMTMVQDGGKFVSLTHRPALPLGNTPGTHFC